MKKVEVGNIYKLLYTGDTHGVFKGSIERIYIIVGVDIHSGMAKAVTSTTNVTAERLNTRVYGSLTINGKTKNNCFFTDEPVDINIDVLRDPIGIVPKETMSIIMDKVKELSDRGIQAGMSKVGKKLFISHSSEDIRSVSAFVDLLEVLGFNEFNLVCTSFVGFNIPLGNNIFDWLKMQFNENNLHVLLMLSDNYYKSSACLNEMGAAWVKSCSCDVIILPNFTYNRMQGCVDSRKIGIQIDGDEAELKQRLGELKDRLIKEFELPSIKAERWEKHRDEFIKKIKMSEIL